MSPAYAIVSALLLAFIALIWSSANLLNVIIKLMFTAAAVWGGFEVLKALGWIVKVS